MQTTFPELASSMGKVIPLAGAMKVKQEELFGAMATLTGVTGNTAEVSTQLRGVFQGFMKPTSEMSAALEKMGYKTGAAALESLGFEGALGELKKAVGGNETELVNMFGSVEAGTAVLALTGSQADKFTEKNKAMAEAAGATSEAFKIQQATVSAMMAKMTTSFNVVMITLGEKLLPMFNNVLEWVIKHMPEIKQGIDNAMTTVSDVVEIVITKFKKIIEVGKEIAETIFPNLDTESFDLGETIKDLTTKAFDILITALTWVRDNLPLVKGAVIALTTVWVAQKVIVLLYNIALSAHKTILIATKVATKAITVVQWLFNAAMSANPIVKVIALLVLLGAGIYEVVKHWKDIVKWIKKAWDWLNIWNDEDIEDKNTNVNTNYTTSGSPYGGARPPIAQEAYGGARPPGNARGTNNWRGGLTWVGEQGAELIDLQKGAKVYSHEKSMDMAKGNDKGFNLNIETFVNERKQDVEELAEELSYYIKKKELGGV